MSTAVFRAFLLATTFLPVTWLPAQFSDNFDDQDLTNGPVWSGSSVFIANASGQLQLNDAIASSSYLQSDFAMPSLDDMEWRVQVQQTFAPSGSNYGRVYLVSDQLNLFASLNGYYLQFGEAGSADAVELFQQTGVISTSVCRGPDGQVAASFSIGVQVKRDAAGNWTLAVDADGGTDFLQVASGIENTWTSSAHLGVQCVYTASNADNFFYDDFYAGPTIVDADPPTLVSATVISATQIDLAFSEAVEQITAEEENNYSIIPFNSAASVVRDGTDLALVHLTLAIAMQSGNTYTITVNGVEDLSGNACVNESEDVLYFVPDEALPGEVVINEIFPDPTPTVALPEAEFIEVFNTTTNKTFDLAGWIITDGSSNGTLPSTSIPPGAHVILTDPNSASSFTGFGTVVGVPSFPSLNNDGDPLELKDDNAAVIDAVTYDISWYNDAVKADGGWTLERIDPTTPCSGANNWIASTDTDGGTPGAQNSVFSVVPDQTAPALLSALVTPPTTIELAFNELLDATSIGTATYTISPSGAVINVANGPAPLTTVVLTLDAPLVAGVLYTITVEGVEDCPGNAIGSANTAQFALPEPVAAGDVVINEVLYDPRVGGYDFVELYNRSNKTISLADLALANEEDGEIANVTPITTEPNLLLPGQYVAITEDPSNIAAEYPLGVPSRYLLADLPSFNNEEGSVVLQANGGSTFEIFRYNDDMHFLLLNETEGVSLERVDPARAADDATNWHSASEVVGWATPGYLNSQFSEAPNASGELTIDPAIFSPDNDGYQDVITATYKFEEPGFTGTMKVFDLAGREERILLNNVLLGVEGSVSWDGILEDGTKGRIGPHIFVFEVFDLAGNVLRYRETVVLAHKLN